MGRHRNESNKYSNITIIAEKQVRRVWVLICSKWPVYYSATHILKSNLAILREARKLLKYYSRISLMNTDKENRSSPPTFCLTN